VQPYLRHIGDVQCWAVVYGNTISHQSSGQFRVQLQIHGGKPTRRDA
jgi:hypothetical protein